MSEQTLEQLVDALPDETGWYKNSSRESVLAVAKEMSRLGISKNDIWAILQEMYIAISAEFGS